MKPKVFHEKLAKNPRPVVVDLWAPWCGPCMMVKPTLENLAKEYAGRVDLWQINADESQELLQELGVFGIPTLIVYRNGRETLRQVGAKPAGTLKAMFEALATGREPEPAGLSNIQRLLRLAAGTLLVFLGWTNQFNWILLGLGAIVLFSAVYDRCPIWRALTAQFRKMTAR
jgi:thioredoxin 1